MRIARNAADRQQKPYPICQLRWDHSKNHIFAHRDPSASLLWTLFRNPTRRLVSTFYHFYVTRENVTANVANLQRMLSQNYETHQHYYLKQASLLLPNPGEAKDHTTNQSKHVESILRDIDFIGITERMDESLVALSLLWGLPLGDVLYMSAKTSGGYDGGGQGCRKIQPAPSPLDVDMQQLLKSHFFQNLTKWDRVVYQLANQSLDLTIEQTIGRDKFDPALIQFQQALQVVHERCGGEVVTPCSNGGVREPGSDAVGKPYPPTTTDCLALDSGCGYMCLDDVATELGLWDDAPFGGELSYRYPGAFGLGESTQKRIRARYTLQQNSSRELPEETTKWPTGLEHLTVPPEAQVYNEKLLNLHRQRDQARRQRGGIFGMMLQIAGETTMRHPPQSLSRVEQINQQKQKRSSGFRGQQQQQGNMT